MEKEDVSEILDKYNFKDSFIKNLLFEFKEDLETNIIFVISLDEINNKHLPAHKIELTFFDCINFNYSTDAGFRLGLKINSIIFNNDTPLIDKALIGKDTHKTYENLIGMYYHFNLSLVDTEIDIVATAIDIKFVK